jgi:hypothetical protein
MHKYGDIVWIQYGYGLNTTWIWYGYGMDTVWIWYGYVFIQYGKQYGAEVLTCGL